MHMRHILSMLSTHDSDGQNNVMPQSRSASILGRVQEAAASKSSPKTRKQR